MPAINREASRSGAQGHQSANPSVRLPQQTKPANLFNDAVPVSSLPTDGVKFLIFGMSGTGKTTLACDFPKPLLLVRPEEVEDGSRSVRTVPGVDVTPCMVDPNQLSEVVEGQRSTGKYRTIVLDGVDRLQDLVTKKHMGLHDVPVQMTYMAVPEADWNIIGITLKAHIRDLLRLTVQGTNVVLLGGERSVGEGDDRNKQRRFQSQAPHIMVSLTPSTTGWLHAICDYNVHTFTRPKTIEVEGTVAGKKQKMTKQIDQQDFCLHVAAHDLYMTKFRKPKEQELPTIMVDPTFAKLEALIAGTQA